MNRFNVLLLEDDCDDGDADADELNLDNSYFSELEDSALIADIEQCLVQHEHFEIAATFGGGGFHNAYTLRIDIDDALGDWPAPLAALHSPNPFRSASCPCTDSRPTMVNKHRHRYMHISSSSSRRTCRHQRRSSRVDVRSASPRR